MRAVCLHNSHLAAKYPYCAEETPFGDRLDWLLCPVVADIGAYVIALCRDLVQNYGVRRLELETCNFGRCGHAHCHMKDGVNPGNIGRYLFGLSLSAGCKERAVQRGIDAEQLRDWVCRQLALVLAAGPPLSGDLDEFVRVHQDFSVFKL